MFWVFDSSVGEAFKRRDEAGQLLSFAGICRIQAYMCATRKRATLCQITLRFRPVWLCMSVLCAQIRDFLHERMFLYGHYWMLERFGVLSRFSPEEQRKERLHTPEPSKLTVVGMGWLYFPRQFQSSPFTSVCLLAPRQLAVWLIQAASTSPYKWLLLSPPFDWGPSERPRLIWQEALFFLVTSGAGSRWRPVSLPVRHWDAEVGPGVFASERRKETGGMVTKQKCYSSATVSHQAWICLLSASFYAFYSFFQTPQGVQTRIQSADKQGQDTGKQEGKK